MLRKTLFWLHLTAGVLAGLSIAVMCFTGTALAFEKELVAWAERDARRVAPPPAGAPRLPLAELQARLRAAQPDARPVGIVIQHDPRAAVAFTTGRTGGFYANPYTGEIRQPHSSAMSNFMRTMTEWHRYLGFGGEVSRPRGKWINGVCNLAFCTLALTGLYLWWPRTWSWRGVQAIALFNWRLSGKARDFNWHNAIGLWSAPVLIVLTLTAVPISFRWGGNLIYALTGTPAPAAPGGGAAGGAGGRGPGGPAIEVPAPAPDAKPLSPDDLLAAVLRQTPRWETITLRTGASRSASSTAPAATFTIRTGESWPRTATTALTLDPYTGAILRRTGFADQNTAQRVRSWTRFLHTGEALGWGGQLVAGFACLGGCFLVWTGFALTWRRFFVRRAT